MNVRAWVTAHRKQLLLGGGGGVAGYALYRRSKDKNNPAGTITETPVTYGDPQGGGADGSIPYDQTATVAALQQIARNMRRSAKSERTTLAKVRAGLRALRQTVREEARRTRRLERRLARREARRSTIRTPRRRPGDGGRPKRRPIKKRPVTRPRPKIARLAAPVFDGRRANPRPHPIARHDNPHPRPAAARATRRFPTRSPVHRRRRR